MRRILNKYVFLISCLFVGFVVLADTPSPPGYPGGVPPSPSDGCCREFEGEDENGNPSQQWLDCIAAETEEPGSYCADTVPVDNSIYIYISMVAGVALASFVIARRIKT
ncbi:hypothetical protein AAGV33_13425 [Flavobacterium sp. FBOR7N2.3]|uniref:Uncharacterized protein n=1 Tax=Flavobacterium magnesitis TaxID=3138077 RepID=A0ABV4TQ90_9FLAO